MLEINLFDSNFIHTEQLVGYITCTHFLKPTKIKWLNGLKSYNGITVFTDNYIGNSIVKQINSKIKVAWLLEPLALVPSIYNTIIDVEDDFDYILTYDEELLKRSSKYLKYVVGQSRVTDEESGIHQKNKLVSMIASHKRMSEGHRYRHEIIDKLYYKHKFDLWGSGYNSFQSKNEPLKDYYFSISVMNSKVKDFFTEVLVDNLRLGTVPIFWGCPNIGEYFDINGIITFNTIEELDYILSNLTVEDYYKRLQSIQTNLELSQKYVSTDDIIADVIINKIL